MERMNFSRVPCFHVGRIDRLFPSYQILCDVSRMTKYEFEFLIRSYSVI